MTNGSSQVLLVANERQAGLVSELVELMFRDKMTFGIAIGREDAIQKIKNGNYKAVYLPGTEIDLGSERRPSEDFYRLAVGCYGSIHRTAAMFEIVKVARENGLEVVVSEDEGILNEQLKELGAIPSNLLTKNAFGEYQAIKSALERNP